MPLTVQVTKVQWDVSAVPFFSTQAESTTCQTSCDCVLEPLDTV